MIEEKGGGTNNYSTRLNTVRNQSLKVSVCMCNYKNLGR